MRQRDDRPCAAGGCPGARHRGTKFCERHLDAARGEMHRARYFGPLPRSRPGAAFFERPPGYQVLGPQGGRVLGPDPATSY